MLLSTEKVSHSHLVQHRGSCRSMYNKGLEQGEKMALLYLGKKYRAEDNNAFFWEGGLTSSLISPFSSLSTSISHTAHRNVVSSSAQTMTAQQTFVSMWTCSFFFFFLFQDFKDTNNKWEEKLWHTPNVIIQGSK